MKKKYFFVVMILITALLLASGCGAGVEPVQESASASATPSQAPTPTATPSPTPDASALAAASEKAAMDELDMRIQAFLNYQGVYAPESITYISSGVKEITKLGLVNSGPWIEGVLLGYVDKGDSILLIVGFDGKDGERFVTPLLILIYPLADPDPMISFRFSQYSAPIIDYDTEYTSTKSKEEILNVLSEQEDKVITVQLFTKADNSGQFKDNPLVDRAIEQGNEAVPYTNDLGDMLVKNDVDFNFNTPDGIKIEKIESASDVSKIDFSKVTVISLMGFFNKDFEGIVK